MGIGTYLKVGLKLIVISIVSVVLLALVTLLSSAVGALTQSYIILSWVVLSILINGYIGNKLWKWK